MSRSVVSGAVVAALSAALVGTALLVGTGAAHGAPAPSGAPAAVPAAVATTGTTTETVTPTATATTTAPPPKLPDLRMARLQGTGEDHALPLGTGRDGEFLAVLSNTGASVPSATLTITLPAGLGVDASQGVIRDDQYQSSNDNGGKQLTCTTVSATEVTCALGATKSGLNTLIAVPVQALPSAVVGTTATFTVSALADSGKDSSPKNNSTTGMVTFAGIAHLVLTLNPSATSASVGTTIHIVATLHNDGPQPTADGIGFLALQNKHFQIIGFTGNKIPLGGGSGGSGGGSATLSASASAASVADATSAVSPSELYAALARSSSVADASTSALTGVSVTGSGHAPVVGWNIGTVASGASITATLTLKAESRGTERLVAEALSEAGDPACNTPAPTAACTSFTTLTLKVTKRVTSKPSHPHSSGHHTSGGGTLADTGVPVEQLTTAGGAAILAGALLFVGGVGATRRRRHVRQH